MGGGVKFKVTGRFRSSTQFLFEDETVAYPSHYQLF